MNNKLYQKLRPKKSDVILIYVYTAALMAVILILGIVFCYMAYAEGDRGAMTVSAVILMGLLALVGWFGKTNIRNTKQLTVRKGERIAGLTETDFEMLENEILTAEMRFKTFYLLEHYIYAPKVKLLLRYEEIGQWKTVRHTTNYIPDGAWVELTDTSGCMQKIVIRKWRQYLMDLDGFVGELNFRKGQAMDGGNEQR